MPDSGGPSSSTLRLRLNERVLAPRSATLILAIASESWVDPAWRYGVDHLNASWQLDVVVDASSGEDGAPAPSLTFFLPEPQALAPLSQWPGLQFVDPQARFSEAWYGNDAPALTRNVLTFGPWHGPRHIELQWDACYDDWQPRTPQAPFRLSGPVDFGGITMQVKDDGDAARFFDALLPQVDRGELAMQWQPWIEHPPSMPADRRRWHPLIWSRRVG
jgi:hypothetical protein